MEIKIKMENKTLKERISENFREIVITAILVTGISNGVYLFGNYTGFKEGERKAKEEIIIDLSMNRYDAHQNAKFASNLERQNEILKDAEAVNIVFRMLDRNRYFDSLSDSVYESAFS